MRTRFLLGSVVLVFACLPSYQRALEARLDAPPPPSPGWLHTYVLHNRTLLATQLFNAGMPVLVAEAVVWMVEEPDNWYGSTGAKQPLPPDGLPAGPPTCLRLRAAPALVHPHWYAGGIWPRVLTQGGGISPFRYGYLLFAGVLLIWPHLMMWSMLSTDASLRNNRGDGTPHVESTPP